jgi:hypothetical protein
VLCEFSQHSSQSSGAGAVRCPASSGTKELRPAPSAKRSRRQCPDHPRLSPIDRLLWVWLHRLWPRCLETTVLVEPVTCSTGTVKAFGSMALALKVRTSVDRARSSNRRSSGSGSTEANCRRAIMGRFYIPTKFTRLKSLRTGQTSSENLGVEPGQVWQAGAHRIVCGDSSERRNLEKPGAEPF